MFVLCSTRMLDEAKIGVKKSRNTLHDDTKPARIDYVIVHPEYNNVRRDRNRFQHDIAVLRLKRRIALNKEQRAIELPRGVPSGFPPSGTANVSAAGWGYRTRFTGPVGDRDPEDIPERLQQANVTIISRAKCATRQPLLNITEDMFCIDSSKTDICQVGIVHIMVKNGRLLKPHEFLFHFKGKKIELDYSKI